MKLQWNAKSKVGSLDNATYKPGGGDKKIETVKLDFKDKAKPKVGSKENAKHVPGGGTVKVKLVLKSYLQILFKTDHIASCTTTFLLINNQFSYFFNVKINV